MVHSIELLFDRDTEAALRRIWDDLATADIPSQAPAGRPHVTLAVAERIAPEVDALLRPAAQRLPLGCTVGASLLFGRSNAVLARLIVPTAELLALHAEVHRICGPYLATRPRCRTACPVSGRRMSRWPAESGEPNSGGPCVSPADRQSCVALWPVCAAGTAANASTT